MKQSKYNDEAFLSLTTIGIFFVVTSVITFAFWYTGAFDGFSDFLGGTGGVYDTLLDGNALGDWIAGVLIGGIVGILKGLWDFGLDVGLTASDMV